MPAPVPLEISPPVAAAIGAAGLFVASVLRGFLTKPKPKPEDGDTVVVSAAFADAKPMRELTDVVRELIAEQRASRDATDRFDDNQSSRSIRLVKAMEDVADVDRRVLEELRSIHATVGAGVRIVPATPPPG